MFSIVRHRAPIIIYLSAGVHRYLSGTNEDIIRPRDVSPMLVSGSPSISPGVGRIRYRKRNRPALIYSGDKGAENGRRGPRPRRTPSFCFTKYRPRIGLRRNSKLRRRWMASITTRTSWSRSPEVAGFDGGVKEPHVRVRGGSDD